MNKAILNRNLRKLHLWFGIGIGHAWVYFAAFLFIFGCHFYVKYEEQHLSENFGEAFSNYRTKVRRWI
jgi:protein-S-isoprenylcysteine O-methyltransferase Ste14